jgi:hypothetical protein
MTASRKTQSSSSCSQGKSETKTGIQIVHFEDREERLEAGSLISRGGLARHRGPARQGQALAAGFDFIELHGA